MKILLVAATVAEILPALAHYGITVSRAHKQRFTTSRHTVHICITGGGLMQATFSLARVLLEDKYDFALQAGIGGTFDLQDVLGNVVAVRRERLGDAGAEDQEQFIDLFDLGFADKHERPFHDGWLVNPMTGIPFLLPNEIRDGITVSTVSGHAPTIEKRRAQFNPGVESMEGAALHYTCLQLNIPFLQIRALSNYITPRNRDSWQIGKAIASLNNTLIDWLG
jgi:futalosine hydrolase